MVGEQGQHVLDVAIGLLDDLELRQQQVGRRQRPGPGVVQAVAERQLVAHPERVDEHVDPTAAGVVEEQPLRAVERVELAGGARSRVRPSARAIAGAPAGATRSMS